MTKIALLASLLALASCTDSSPGQDLGSFSSGKSDVAEIAVPIRIAPGGSAEFVVTVDGPFEIATRYAPAGQLELVASTAEGATTEATGDQPSLRVDAERETRTTFTLAAANKSTAEIAGTLEIRNPTAGCSEETWTGWFQTLVGKLDTTNDVIDDQERALLDAIVAARPCVSTSAAAYSTWFTRLTAELGNANLQIDDHEMLRITYVQAARPLASGDPVYLEWVKLLATMLGNAGTMIDADEREFFDIVLAAKPCAAGTEALAAWNRLAAGAVPDVAILTAAHPTAACN